MQPPQGSPGWSDFNPNPFLPSRRPRRLGSASREPGDLHLPLYLAEELLRLEGFTQVEYVEFKTGNLFTAAVATGQVDLALNFIGPLVISMDERAPIVILAGVHAGCFELFGSGQVRAIRDLKGKTVAVPGQREPHMSSPPA